MVQFLESTKGLATSIVFEIYTWYVKIKYLAVRAEVRARIFPAITYQVSAFWITELSGCNSCRPAWWNQLRFLLHDIWELTALAKLGFAHFSGTEFKTFLRKTLAWNEVVLTNELRQSLHTTHHVKDNCLLRCRPQNFRVRNSLKQPKHDCQLVQCYFQGLSRPIVNYIIDFSNIIWRLPRTFTDRTHPINQTPQMEGPLVISYLTFWVMKFSMHCDKWSAPRIIDLRFCQKGCHASPPSTHLHIDLWMSSWGHLHCAVSF